MPKLLKIKLVAVLVYISMNCLCNGKAYLKHSIITVTHIVLFIEAELLH